MTSAMKFDVEKFNGKIDFGLWQINMKDLLIQSGTHKALKGKPTSNDSGKAGSSMSDEDWEDLDLRAASSIRLALAKNVLPNVKGISGAKEIWEKLEALYQGKGISSRLNLKEQFHTLRMDEGSRISDHLSALNHIFTELETIGVKIDDEDKALRLILSLPTSYEHMKPILMYGKETLDFAEIASKLISEERRLKNGGRDFTVRDSTDSVLAVNEKRKKNVVEQVRQKALNQKLTLSCLMICYEVESTSSWYLRFTMEEDVLWCVVSMADELPEGANMEVAP
ncbi:hypothetical protein GQ457_16G027410 [Hibiscus cannabinus]